MPRISSLVSTVCSGWRSCLALLMMCALAIGMPAGVAHAESRNEIDAGVAKTLALFKSEVPGGAQFLNDTAGALVFPKVLKGGFGVGGEYGEGALVTGGTPVEYYSTASASIGFQFGLQSKAVVIVFRTQEALSQFRRSDGWKAGVDGSVAIAEWGLGDNINTLEHKSPVVGFILSNKGLMYNLTIEGSKFTKIVR